MTLHIQYQANPHKTISQSPQPKRKVLLVSYYWDILCEMPSLLSEAGFEVHLLCKAANCAIHNRYYDYWIDAGDDLTVFYHTLYQLDQSNSYVKIIIGEDPLLWQIHTNPIAELNHLLPIKNKQAQHILSKVNFSHFCRQHHIPTPNYASVQHPNDIPMALAQVGLPLLIKPSYSNGGQGIMVCHTPADYETAWKTIQLNQPYLVQAYVAGQLLSVEAIYSNGQLIDYASSYILNDDLGASTARNYQAKQPKLTQLLQQLGNASQLDGFVNITLIHEHTTHYQLIEADPRPNRWVGVGQSFQADFIKALQIWIENQPIPPIQHQPLNQACTQVETMPAHTVKLINQGKLIEALIHLSDFDKTWRYLIHDPVQLEHRLRKLHEGLLRAQHQVSN